VSDTAEKKSWFGRIKAGLSRSSAKIGDGITGIFAKRKLDDETLAQLEELLISADLGWGLAEEATKRLREGRRFNQEVAPEEIKAALAETIVPFLEPVEQPLRLDPTLKPQVILVVGANGSGKTTTIGKLAKLWRDDGLEVVLAAGDTFRAAAADQLEEWAERTGADLVRAHEGADPGSVVHDALGRAKARGADLVLADTAGRRANSTNLLDELAKVRRVADREPGQVVETLMVLDATTGQNALSQAKEFLAAAQVTGIVLTKLDGTARGGIVVAIERELSIPVKFIGVGEGVGDLIVFEPEAFVDSLLSA